MLLVRVVQALRKVRVPHAVVGGYAVALHGAVRGTLDLDLVLRHREPDFVRAEKALRSLGLRSRLPVSAAEVHRFRDEYVRNRHLTAWSFANPDVPSELVDIVLTHDLSAMKIRRILVRGRQVPVASIGDLIAMKRTSGRPQDLEDVRALEQLR